jgi:hypothetical protein
MRFAGALGLVGAMASPPVVFKAVVVEGILAAKEFETIATVGVLEVLVVRRFTNDFGFVVNALAEAFEDTKATKKTLKATK